MLTGNETVATDAVKEAVQVENPLANIKFNADCFTPVYMKLKESKVEGDDEKLVRELSTYVHTSALENMVTLLPLRYIYNSRFMKFVLILRLFRLILIC
jgi:hypothetical protein